MSTPSKRCGGRKNTQFPFTVKEMKEKLISNIGRLKVARSKTDIRKMTRKTLCRYFSTKNSRMLRFNLDLIKGKQRRARSPIRTPEAPSPNKRRKRAKSVSKSPRRSASSRSRSTSKSPRRTPSRSPRRSFSMSPRRNSPIRTPEPFEKRRKSKSKK